jgi:hypothetical protein
MPTPFGSTNTHPLATVVATITIIQELTSKRNMWLST